MICEQAVCEVFRQSSSGDISFRDYIDIRRRHTGTFQSYSDLDQWAENVDEM